jgi:hypothetical protein
MLHMSRACDTDYMSGASTPEFLGSATQRKASWLLLVYQLPTRPSNIRVRTWRRLQDVGAAGLKNSAYVLPNSPQAQEDFEWIKTEILAMKGQANVFVADHLDTATEDEIVAAFHRARQADFEKIRRETQKLLKKIKAGRMATPIRKRLARTSRLLRERWNEVSAIDFFQAPGREEAGALLDLLDRRVANGEPATGKKSREGDTLMGEQFRLQTWVTRPRPGVDRMSSAWLIKKFIDTEAKFAFAEKPDGAPGAVPFDMFGVKFSHEGNSCTFETLVRRFGIRSSAVERIGQIVHDLDLKEERYDLPETIAVGRLIEGLRLLHQDDQELLNKGMELFEALYRSLAIAKPAGKVGGKKQERKQARSFTGLT